MSKILEEVERGEREVIEAEPFEAPLSRNADKFTSSELHSNVEKPITTPNSKPTGGLGTDEMKFPAWNEERSVFLVEEHTTRIHSNGPTYRTRAEVQARFDAAWKLANEFLAGNEDSDMKEDDTKGNGKEKA